MAFQKGNFHPAHRFNQEKEQNRITSWLKIEINVTNPICKEDNYKTQTNFFAFSASFVAFSPFPGMLFPPAGSLSQFHWPPGHVLPWNLTLAESIREILLVILQPLSWTHSRKASLRLQKSVLPHTKLPAWETVSWSTAVCKHQLILGRFGSRLERKF